ncbi:helix-turn-helix domain-containing protein, partial [candidate division WOR-3 bacterium]|nr:helix-turn-helix domain-containing protein [candidate division WOR-3 bacterium]
SITTKDIGFEKVKREEIIPLKEIKKEAIIEALKEALNVSHGSVKKTAQMLGINRKTIQRYIKQYNITKQT